ncbi:ribonuclease domain-containing protein [Streptomyces sp. NPDC048717]|uniref:ribonuclease domain-containing protein n=1 Tax=unclassified Streptomyces TaxID=2593676 RepID=UPI00343A96C4
MIMRNARLGLGLLAGLALFLTGCAGGSGTIDGSPAPARTTATAAPLPFAPSARATAAPSARATAAPTAHSGLPTVREADLPREARDTMGLIRAGGPYPYTKDGTVFGNFERVLPQHKRGYYHEYTVKTPGSRDRGARRIVTGQEHEFFYTDDHYASFREVITK